MGSSTHEYALPISLKDWLVVTEIEAGASIARNLFEKKFGGPPPEFGRHVIVFYRERGGGYHPLSYLHCWTQGSIGLIGGACTDGEIMRSMETAQAEAVNAEGGLFKQTLLYVMAHFNQGLDVFFARSGDARARDVMLNLGFCEVEKQPLLAEFVRELGPLERQERINQAIALGAF